MSTIIRLKEEELNSEFLEKVKKLFKGKEITVFIDDEMDETDFLLSTESNRNRIKESIAQLRRGETIEMTLEQLKQL